MGIGVIPNAVLAALGDRRELGTYTEMFNDGVVDLVERGVITGEAWAVMQHLTSAQTHLALSDVRIPGRKSVLDTWLAQNPSEPPKNRNVAKTGQQSLHIRPTSPLWDRIEREVFTPLLAPLWNNRAIPRDVTREITAQANRILAGS